MNVQSRVSICIPAYNQPALLERCLESIRQQDYPNAEIIVSDDSTGPETKIIIDRYQGPYPLRYLHHAPGLGSPRNWNAALEAASGELILLLHQDDWFSTAHSLSRLARPLLEQPGLDFSFCRNTGQTESGETIRFQQEDSILQNLYQEPEALILSNQIGPPSNVLIRKKSLLLYDVNLQWLVDIELYLRMLRQGMKGQFVPEHLVNIGIHADQMTNICRDNPRRVIYENMYVFNRVRAGVLRRWRYYDFYWRLFRNAGLRGSAQLKHWCPDLELHPVFLKMADQQARIPEALLKRGLFSKFFMFNSYLWNQSILPS